MKKFVLTVLTVLTCGALHALPAGNPADASLYTNNFWFGDSCYDPCDPCGSWCDMFNIRLGFYGDYVFNRHLETKSDSTVVTDNGGDIYKTTISTNAGLIVLNVCEWMDLFGTIGVSNFHILTEDSVWGSANPVMSELGFSPEMSYSGGLRATLWACDNFMVGAEAQYFYSNAQLNTFLPYDSGFVTYFSNSKSAPYQEWQVAIGAAYRFENEANFAFIPYANLETSGVNWKLRNDFTPDNDDRRVLQSLKSSKVIGWSLGMTALLCDLIGVTVEGRWANEKAFHVNGQLSF